MIIVTTIQTQVAEVQSGVSKQGREQVLDWLCSHDYSDQLEANTGLHQAGTGQWLLDDSMFTDWEKSSSSSTLFCHGGPGTGKTIMSAQVVGHLQKKSSGFGKPVLYIFCDYKMRAEQNITHLLASLLRQLGFFSSDVFEKLKQLHAQCKEKSSRLAKTDLEQALEASLTIVGDTYIVVDALDECEKSPRSSLIRILREKSAKCTIHLLATARNENDIETLFGGCPAILIRASDKDIKLYAKKHTEGFEQPLVDNQDLCSEVVQAVVNASEGM
jgi:hypothetical protein